jgi:hypothetical protein
MYESVMCNTISVTIILQVQPYGKVSLTHGSQCLGFGVIDLDDLV